MFYILIQCCLATSDDFHVRGNGGCQNSGRKETLLSQNLSVKYVADIKAPQVKGNVSMTWRHCVLCLVYSGSGEMLELNIKLPGDIGLENACISELVSTDQLQ